MYVHKENENVEPNVLAGYFNASMTKIETIAESVSAYYYIYLLHQLGTIKCIIIIIITSQNTIYCGGKPEHHIRNVTSRRVGVVICGPRLFPDL